MVSSAVGAASTTFAFSASASPPAWVTASATAFTMARLEMVAPVTASQARDWCSTIQSGNVSTGEGGMPAPMP